MSKPLHGHVVAITGGARGIGLATATHLASLGAKVVIGDIDEAELPRAAAASGAIAHTRVDVTDRDSFAAFLDLVERDAGPLTVLVNNAGIMPVGRIIDEPEHIARRMMDINVLGVITGTKLALERMLPRRSGHIINIASLAGEYQFPGLATYCATKHAVLGFTGTVRKEVAGDGISVCAVLPTLTNTQLGSGASGIRGVRVPEAVEIAAAIERQIRKPVPRLRVTRLAGVLVQSQHYLPPFVYQAISRALGAETMFISGIDEEVRRSYEERIRTS